MKLSITLDETQREALQESAAHLTKLLKKFALVEKQHAEYEAIKIKATARLAAKQQVALDKVGTEPGEAASAMVFAIQHQLGQLGLTLRRLEGEFVDLEKEAAQAAYGGRELPSALPPVWQPQPVGSASRKGEEGTAETVQGRGGFLAAPRVAHVRASLPHVNHIALRMVEASTGDDRKSHRRGPKLPPSPDRIYRACAGRDRRAGAGETILNHGR